MLIVVASLFESTIKQFYHLSYCPVFGGHFCLRQARQNFRHFVLDGIAQKTNIWSELKSQIYLGDETFVSEMLRKIDKDRKLWDIPEKQGRAAAKTLAEIEQQAAARNSAIKAAYTTGSYSQREIGEYFHLHPSTVGVIVRKGNNS